MIRGHGAANPKAFIIADVAYGEDLNTEYAISGYQERFLDGMCRDNGMRLDEFYRTLLIKDQELGQEKNLEIFCHEVNDLKPNLLIPLGESGFHFLTGLQGILKFRGSVLPVNCPQLPQPAKVLPILGPYPYINQNYKMRFISRIDFGKISKHCNEGPIPDNYYNIWVARSSSALRAFLERHYQKTLDSDGYLNFDIETFCGIPTCISFCFDGFESCCIPLLDQSIDLDNRTLMMGMVSKILASPIRKVNQNIKYDWKLLERWGFQVNNVVGDPMLGASVLYCEFPKNLGFLTSIYTDLPYFKDEGKEFDPSKFKKDQFYLYNAKDSLASHIIYGKQIEELNELGVRQVYENLVLVTPHYRLMENRGLRVSESRRDKLLAKYESLFQILSRSLRRASGKPSLNALSSAQIRTLIFDELGYKPVRGMKKTKSGEPSTDEESLLLLSIYGDADKAPSTGPEILSLVISCRKVHKVVEILQLPLYPDGRFRCEYNLAGTETGRTSAGETLDEYFYFEDGSINKVKLGHSLQTIGKHGFAIDGVTYGRDIRSMYVPTDGYSFVECDLSQAEARVDAVLANNIDILSVFDGPVGIHKLTGSWVYNCDPLDIKKNKLVDGVDRYHMAKTVRHAGERNMGADRMVMMTQRPLMECKQILDTFHKYQPEIKQVFHRDVVKCIDTQHCLIAPNGRRRDFYDRIDKHTYNEGISFLPQAIVSDQTKFSFIRTFDKSECGRWSYLIAEAHDGALAEVRIGRELEFAETYRKNVQTPIDFRFCSLPRDYQLIIPCEAASGEDWEHLIELK